MLLMKKFKRKIYEKRLISFKIHDQIKAQQFAI